MDIPERIDFSIKECAFYLMARYPDKYKGIGSAYHAIKKVIKKGDMKTVSVPLFKGKRVERQELIRVLGIR